MNPVMLMACLAGGAATGQSEGKIVFQAPFIKVLEQSPLRELHYNRELIATNFMRPERRDDAGNPQVDFSRIPTTYFHAKSPIGLVMRTYDWFPGRENIYDADARLPASLPGLALDPLSQIVALWSEPPIAVVGMEAGTMASYARPTQIVHFIEHVPEFVKLSFPANDRKPIFHYVEDALNRGAQVKVFEGERRETLKKHGGERFYQVIVIDTYSHKSAVKTIPKDLMTKEAMRMLMDKTREGGILCYHTSSRYFDLVPILASVSKDLSFASIVAFDSNPWDDYSFRSSSTWVIVARKKEDFAHLREPDGYQRIMRQRRSDTRYWKLPDDGDAKYVWTDKGENSFRGLHRCDPEIEAIQEFVAHIRERLAKLVPGRRINVFFEPIHRFLREWSRVSAQAMNREPGEPIRRDAKKN